MTHLETVVNAYWLSIRPGCGRFEGQTRQPWGSHGGPNLKGIPRHLFVPTAWGFQVFTRLLKAKTPCQCKEPKAWWGVAFMRRGVHLLFKKKFYWSVVISQCSVGFWHTAKWISSMYTYCRVRELEKARFGERSRPALYRNRSPLMRREGAAFR